MGKQRIRALITGAGTGSSGNLIRALGAMTPKPYAVGVNDDRFILGMSLADCNYLVPESQSDGYIDAVRAIIKKEEINVVLPVDDHSVKALSEGRERLPISLLLPQRSTIDLCQDKYALNAFLRKRDVPVPRTFQVRSLQSLGKIFGEFSDTGLLWCRARRGSRSLAAIPVATVDQAKAWISLWRDLRGVKVSDFTIGQYLPGRHFIIQSVWHEGSLLGAQAIEVLSYFAAGNNPSGIFSLSSLAKTAPAPDAVAIALRSIRALESRPSGTFIVELKEAADGVPSLTEINAGRFPAGVTALLAVGDPNMVATFANAAIGIMPPRGKRNASPTPPDECYLVRDIDAVPRVLRAKDLVHVGVNHALPRRIV